MSYNTVYLGYEGITILYIEVVKGMIRGLDVKVVKGLLYCISRL